LFSDARTSRGVEYVVVLAVDRLLKRVLVLKSAKETEAKARVTKIRTEKSEQNFFIFHLEKELKVKIMRVRRPSDSQ
jgi:hypothetical protein